MDVFEKYLSLKNIIVFALIVAVILFAGRVADILLMLFAAYVLTCAVNPIVAKLQKFMPRVLAVSIILLLLMVCILGFFIPLFVMTLKQISNIVNEFPTYIDNIQNIINFKLFGFSLAKVVNIEAIRQNSSEILSSALGRSIEAGKIIGNSLTTMFAVAIMVFYLLLDEKHIKNAFIAFFPPHRKEKIEHIVDSISVRVGGYFFATILSMVFVGLLTLIGLLLIGHKHALLLGFITFVLDLIPVIGPTIAVATGLISAAYGGFMFVILTFVIFMIAQWLENQVLRPLIFGKFMDMHPLTIVVSLLVGARFFGVWGVILGPAIASVICVLVDELYLKKINTQEN